MRSVCACPCVCLLLLCSSGHGVPSACMPLSTLSSICVCAGWGGRVVPVLECMRTDPSGPVSGCCCECVLSHLRGSVCLWHVCAYVCLCVCIKSVCLCGWVSCFGLASFCPRESCCVSHLSRPRWPQARAAPGNVAVLSWVCSGPGSPPPPQETRMPQGAFPQSAQG